MPRFDMDDELTPYLQGSTSASWSVRAASGRLGRWDVLGLRMVLAALARANDDTGDHLHAAILNVCGQSAEDGERLAALCSALASDADDAVSGEARKILEPPRSPDLYRP